MPRLTYLTDGTPVAAPRMATGRLVTRYLDGIGLFQDECGWYLAEAKEAGIPAPGDRGRPSCGWPDLWVGYFATPRQAATAWTQISRIPAAYRWAPGIMA